MFIPKWKRPRHIGEFVSKESRKLSSKGEVYILYSNGLSEQHDFVVLPDFCGVRIGQRTLLSALYSLKTLSILPQPTI